MTRIFVFTTGNPEARRHLEDSIKNPVRPKTVFESFPNSLHEGLEDVGELGNGFYAWGAIPASATSPIGNSWRSATTSCASTARPTNTCPGSWPSTTTRILRRPCGGGMRGGGRGSSCTS
jgi:hypothetical protein